MPYLSPRHYKERLDDILEEIDKIHLFTGSMDFEDYLQDAKTQHAVQMCFDHYWGSWKRNSRIDTRKISRNSLEFNPCHAK